MGTKVEVAGDNLIVVVDGTNVAESTIWHAIFFNQKLFDINSSAKSCNCLRIHSQNFIFFIYFFFANSDLMRVVHHQTSMFFRVLLLLDVKF